MLENKCLLEVKGAEDKKIARPGVVYLALLDHHLLVESNGDLALSSEEAVNYSRPSIALVEEPPPPPTPRGAPGRPQRLRRNPRPAAHPI
nr:chemotaxis protein CheB [Brevundimonas diminuta]